MATFLTCLAIVAAIVWCSWIGIRFGEAIGDLCNRWAERK